VSPFSYSSLCLTLAAADYVKYVVCFINVITLSMFSFSWECVCVDIYYLKLIQCVPLATEPGIVGALGSILSGRKWWPLPAHVMMSHFLHNEVSPLQISLQYPH